jgi:hypothetical protein
MMTTAIWIFLGLSSCASLAIVSAVVVGARRSISNEEARTTEATEATPETGSKPSWVPAYNH